MSCGFGCKLLFLRGKENAIDEEGFWWIMRKARIVRNFRGTANFTRKIIFTNKPNYMNFHSETSSIKRYIADCYPQFIAPIEAIQWSNWETDDDIPDGKNSIW